MTGSDRANKGTAETARVVVFRCVAGNPAVSGEALSRLPFVDRDIPIPCAGRLQPEHLLKAFENGADAVCVITCARDDCLFIEGGLRLNHRADSVRRLLAEIGLGGERLIVLEAQLDAEAVGRLLESAAAAIGPSPLRRRAAAPSI